MEPRLEARPARTGYEFPACIHSETPKRHKLSLSFRPSGAYVGAMDASSPLPDFAVFDTETTGLHPDRGDRALEIAIVRMSVDGTVRLRYETLLNPGRAVGATHIHGITAEDVRNAPDFRDVAGEILGHLAGCVLVAHNMEFDFGFLQAECHRIGVRVGDPLRLCTVETARRRYATISSHRLSNLCGALGIPLREAHSGMADCQATADLFLHFLRRTPVQSLADLRAFHLRGDGPFQATGLASEGEAARRPALTREAARRPPPDQQLTLPF